MAKPCPVAKAPVRLRDTRRSVSGFCITARARRLASERKQLGTFPQAEHTMHEAAHERTAIRARALICTFSEKDTDP